MFLFHQLVSEPMVMRFLVNHSCFVDEISLMEVFLYFRIFRILRIWTYFLKRLLNNAWVMILEQRYNFSCFFGGQNRVGMDVDAVNVLYNTVATARGWRWWDNFIWIPKFCELSLWPKIFANLSKRSLTEGQLCKRSVCSLEFWEIIVWPNSLFYFIYSLGQKF